MSEVFSLVVYPLVQETIKYAVDLVNEQYQLLQGVEEDVTKITSILTSIQAVLEDAEKKQQESSSLRQWLGKLEELAYDSQDVLETLNIDALNWQRKQKVRFFKPPGCVSPSKLCYKIKAARAMKKLLSRLDDIDKEKATFDLNVVNGSPGTGSSGENYWRITSPIVPESNIVGRKGDKDNIIDMLLPQKPDSIGEGHLSVIPIVGMGGLGKTTLARLVFNDARLKSGARVKESLMLWVCVGDNYDYRKILSDMIEYHDMKETAGKILNNMIENHDKMEVVSNSLSDVQLETRAKQIPKNGIEWHSKIEIVGNSSLSLVQLETRAKQILEGNRFLLFLDDVWDDSLPDWNKLEDLLKCGGPGSKVLVTTRSENVAKRMGTKPPYKLEILPEKECWLLFEKIVFSQTSSLESSLRTQLKNIGEKVVRRCNGLPLAVEAMGGLLRNETNEEKWRQILRREIWEEEESTTSTKIKILPALRLSYDHLPSEIKPCFAYCCLLPKGHVFHKKELITLWKAASLIKPRGKDDLDDIGSDHFEELLSRSLFQLPNVDNRSECTMHDLIHDLAILVSRPYCYQIMKNDDPLYVSPQVRHIALLCNDPQPRIMDKLCQFKKLRTLIARVEYSRNIGPELDKLLCTYRYMRTLDLSSSLINELPESIRKLKLLSYLDLSKTEIRKLPNSLCELYKLQTLKLLSCPWLFELPKDFSNLANLEHLELDDMFWHKLSTFPSYMGKIKKLENLHAFRVGCEQGEGVDELKDMLHLKESLHISRLENAKKTGDKYLEDKKGLLKVTYEWSGRDCSPQDEAQDRELLEDLRPHSNIKEIGILHYQGDRLPSWLRGLFVGELTTLSLKFCKNIRTLSLGELPQLRKLSLKGLVELEEWSDAGNLHLRRLKIDSCPKLKQMPQYFLNLNVLKIKKCGSLEALPLTLSLEFLRLVENGNLEDLGERSIGVVRSNDQGQHIVVLGHSFLKVLEMTIINCPKVQRLPSKFAPQKLEISGCPLLSALPPSRFAQRLQDLSIDTFNDGTIVGAIPETSSLYSLVISNIQNLRSLPKLPRLLGLRALYIHGCNQLISVSDNGAPYQGLNSLQLLSIQGCSKLETLPEYVLPSALTCLTIGSCASLKSIGPRDVLKKLTSLKDLYIQHCPKLESLPEEGCPTSLKHLRIEGCPFLISRCHESGLDWQKIMNIPDREIVEIPCLDSIEQQPSDENSRAWYHCLTCCVNDLCRGIFRWPF